MNKKVLLIVSIIVLLIVAGGAYLVLNSDDNSKSSSPSTTAVTDSSTQATQPATEKASNAAGAYVDYSEDTIAKTSGTKLVFFYAPWCPQCRALDTDIKASDIPSGVTIIKTDYDSNQKLRQQYGVTIQTTVVKVDDQGNVVKKFVAYDSPTLNSVKSELL